MVEGYPIAIERALPKEAVLTYYEGNDLIFGIQFPNEESTLAWEHTLKYLKEQFLPEEIEISESPREMRERINWLRYLNEYQTKYKLEDGTKYHRCFSCKSYPYYPDGTLKDCIKYFPDQFQEYLTFVRQTTSLNVEDFAKFIHRDNINPSHYYWSQYTLYALMSDFSLEEFEIKAENFMEEVYYYWSEHILVIDEDEEY